MNVLCFVVAVFIINHDKITEAKIFWIIVALILSVFVPVLYLIFSNYKLSKNEKRVNKRFIRNLHSFSTGEKFFDFLVTELEKADKYIFMEYFIVDDGIMWQRIFDILKSKASQLVDVRLMYDGFYANVVGGILCSMI